MDTTVGQHAELETTIDIEEVNLRPESSIDIVYEKLEPTEDGFPPVAEDYEMETIGIELNPLCSDDIPRKTEMPKLSKLKGVGYSCDQCEYVAAEMHNLRHHIASRHKGIRYLCDE